MRGTVKFLIAIAVAILLMVLFRAVAFTVATIEGDGLEPTFEAGDRVLISRWSYGLRTGGTIFSYGRIGGDGVGRGDIVAFDSEGQLLIARCDALPGDTIAGDYVVPSLESCADADYYVMQALGTDSLRMLIQEQQVIGRVCLIVYHHDDSEPMYRGYRASRFFVLPE